jgi:hypothetical protein
MVLFTDHRQSQKSWLDNLLTGHHRQVAADTVRQFLSEYPDYPENLKRKILKSADFLLKSFLPLDSKPINTVSY